MEQQRSIMMMVQDLQANNDSEIADEDNISQRHFPIEDLKALTELENELQSCPETRRKMVNITECVLVLHSIQKHVVDDVLAMFYRYMSLDCWVELT